MIKILALEQLIKLVFMLCLNIVTNIRNNSQILHAQYVDHKKTAFMQGKGYILKINLNV